MILSSLLGAGWTNGSQVLWNDEGILLCRAAREGGMAALEREFGLEELPLSGAYFADRSQEIGMAEVIVPASSDLIGRSVVDARFRSRFGLTVVGLKRGGAVQERMLLHEKLEKRLMSLGAPDSAYANATIASVTARNAVTFSHTVRRSSAASGRSSTSSDRATCSSRVGIQ